MAFKFNHHFGFLPLPSGLLDLRIVPFQFLRRPLHVLFPAALHLAIVLEKLFIQVQPIWMIDRRQPPLLLWIFSACGLVARIPVE